MNFNSLPNELKLQIFKFLTRRELCKTVALVSKHWKELAFDASFWRKINLDFRKHKTIDTMIQLFKYSVVDSESMLRELEFSYYIHDWTITKHVSNLCLLTTLTFFRCKITATVLAELLKHCPKLEKLNFNGCSVTSNESIEEIIKCKNLKNLRLRGCQCFYAEYCIQRVTSECRDLVNFEMSNQDRMDLNYFLPFVDLKNIFLNRVAFKTKRTHSAIKVFITRTDKIDKNNQNHKDVLEIESDLAKSVFLSMTFGKILRKFASLTKVSLKKCQHFDDEVLLVILENCRALKELTCDGCSKLTDNGLIAIACNCRSLQTLSLQNHPSITGRTLLQNLIHLPNLVLLKFNNSPMVDLDDTLTDKIFLKNPNLSIIDREGKVLKTTTNP